MKRPDAGLSILGDQSLATASRLPPSERIVFSLAGIEDLGLATMAQSHDVSRMLLTSAGNAAAGGAPLTRVEKGKKYLGSKQIPLLFEVGCLLPNALHLPRQFDGDGRTQWHLMHS
jgi:hypothetical protein